MKGAFDEPSPFLAILPAAIYYLAERAICEAVLQRSGGLCRALLFTPYNTGMGKVPPAFVIVRLGLLLQGCFTPFHLSRLGSQSSMRAAAAPPSSPRERSHPAWFCSHLVCTRRCKSIRIPVRKALGLPHFGCLSYYRIFLQENSSIHLIIKCRLAVIPGLGPPRCPTLRVYPSSHVP